MLSVIVINHNTSEITRKCLDHIFKSKGIDFEVILINNTPEDGFSYSNPKVRTVNNKVRLGFATNNNVGMKIAKGDKILLLNSDAFVYPDTLAKCYAQDFDILGCQLLNQDLSVQNSWGYYPTLRRIFQFMIFVDNFPMINRYIDTIHVRNKERFKKTKQVDWIMGAFVMLKREVFEKTHGFDENFFMYGEEVEFLYRAHKLGFRSWYFPEAKCVHIQGATLKSLKLMFIGEMNGYIYWFKKYNSKFEQILLRLILILGCLIRIPAWAVWGKWNLVKAYMEVLPQLLNK